MVILHSLSLLVVLLALVAFSTSRSEELNYSNHKGSSIAISGFTNLDNWRMEADSIRCNGSFVFLDGELEDISSLNFTTDVTSLKSSNTQMDSLVYQILSAKGGRAITFVQTHQMVLPRMHMVNIIGNLTIANTTQRIDLQLGYTIGKDKELHFKGLKKIDLTEFSITTSHPLLKAVKFDNQVLVQIEMSLKGSVDSNLNPKNTLVVGTKHF